MPHLNFNVFRPTLPRERVALSLVLTSQGKFQKCGFEISVAFRNDFYVQPCVFKVQRLTIHSHFVSTFTHEKETL